MSLQVEFGLLDDEAFEDAARRIKTERDTYKSLCASQHEVIKGYEEQETAMIAALHEIRQTTIASNSIGEKRAHEIAGDALEKVGVEL